MHAYDVRPAPAEVTMWTIDARPESPVETPPDSQPEAR